MMRKTVSILLSLVFTAAMSLGTPVYAAEQNIPEIASGNEDFSTLTAALKKADLIDALSADGPFTVFAPTNAAFEKLLDSLDVTAEQLLDHPQLKDVLLYHVVSGQVLSTDLKDGMKAETLGGEEVTVDLSNGVKINDATVATPDLMAANGVIHVIDTVLVPSTFKLNASPEPETPATVVDIALSSSDFSILVAALQKADLVETLKGDGPFTVFAPTDAAFEQLLKDLDIKPEQLLNQPDLAKVLLYHVVSGKVMSTDLSDGMQAETLNGESLTIKLGDKVMINDSTVATADLAAGNGVVHVIDKVLVPENFTYQEVDGGSEIPKTGTVGLAPFALAGLVSLIGGIFMKRRQK